MCALGGGRGFSLFLRRSDTIIFNLFVNPVFYKQTKGKKNSYYKDFFFFST